MTPEALCLLGTGLPCPATRSQPRPPCDSPAHSPSHPTIITIAPPTAPPNMPEPTMS